MLIIVRYSISIFLLLLLLVASAVAADLQKGMEAALRGDYAKALAEWIPLAEQGNFKAQYNIGVYYDIDQNDSNDYSKAVYWFKKAAEQGYGPAQHNLGNMYYYGNGLSLIQN